MSSQSSNLTNAFYAESSACIKKATSSVVKKKAENINFCDSAQVKSECLKYTKTAAEVPIDQQTQILFLLRKFNTSAITFAFYMLIGKVGGAAPTASCVDIIVDRNIASDVVVTDVVPIFKSYKRILR